MIPVDSRRKDFLTAGEVTLFLAAARKGRHGVRDYLLGLMAYRHGLRVSELIRIRLDDLDLDGGRMFVRRMKGSVSTSHPMQGDEVRAVRAWLRERRRFLPSGVKACVKEVGFHRQLVGVGRNRKSLACEESPGQKLSWRGLSNCGSTSGGVIPLAERSASGTNSDAARNGGTRLELASLCTVGRPAGSDPVNGEATSRQTSNPGCTSTADSSPFLFLNQERRPFVRTAINWLFHQIGVRAGLGHVHPHQFRHGCGFSLANAGVPTRTIQEYLGHRCIEHTVRYTQLAGKAFDGITWHVA